MKRKRTEKTFHDIETAAREKLYEKWSKRFSNYVFHFLFLWQLQLRKCTSFQLQQSRCLSIYLSLFQSQAICFSVKNSNKSSQMNYYLMNRYTSGKSTNFVTNLQDWKCDYLWKGNFELAETECTKWPNYIAFKNLFIFRQNGKRTDKVI